MIHIFVLNPNAGNREFVTQLRGQIPKDIEYYIFTVSNPGEEGDAIKQARRIFDGEEIRFYCCGGSGTFRNAMNGLDEIGELSKTEMAFIPYGMTNDFLKVFGKDADKFKNIAAMVNGDSIHIDYLKSNHGVALNAISGGIDTNLMRAVEKYRLASTFAKNIPYILGFLSSLFGTKSQDYVIKADDKEYRGRRSEIFVGNGGTIGGFLNIDRKPNFTDGKAYYFLPPAKHGFSIVKLAKDINSGNIEPVRDGIDVGYGNKFVVRRADSKPFDMNCDGEIVHGFTEWEIEVIEKGMKFIVPKGVNCDGIQ